MEHVAKIVNSVEKWQISGGSFILGYTKTWTANVYLSILLIRRKFKLSINDDNLLRKTLEYYGTAGFSVSPNFRYFIDF